MCDSLQGLYDHQAIQIQRRAPQLQIEEDAPGVGQHFADQAMLEVPQIMHTNINAKAIRDQFQTPFISILLFCCTPKPQSADKGNESFSREKMTEFFDR